MSAAGICYRKVILYLFIFTSFTATAQVKLPVIFSDNMVLQRGKPVTIWGRAAAGEAVSVSFAGQTKNAITDTAGNWSVILKKLSASFTPQELTVKGTNIVVIKNILVGDVWLCSGQSNMEYTMDRKKYAAPKKGTDLAMEELKKPGKPDAIRYIYAERKLSNPNVPIPQLPSTGWFTGNDTALKDVSAIGYFFAKEINEKVNVPIGIISSSWGGTRIEEWTLPDEYKSSPVFKDSVTNDTLRIVGMKPGFKYKGMIQPIVPFAVKGVLWYQGESNCMIEDQATYHEKFLIFVNQWRRLFKDEKLPFYTVQISPYLYTARKDAKKHKADLLPQFWEAQTQCLDIPNVEMVVTTDLVDNLADIHPSYKWIVGHRLALTALNKSYKEKSTEYSGPLYRSMKIKNNTIILNFDHAAGLQSSDGNPLSWFTIANEDGNFVSAKVSISNDRLIISAANISNPKYVRFAWSETAQPNLVNGEGLPARPFRTDNLKIN